MGSKGRNFDINEKKTDTNKYRNFIENYNKARTFRRSILGDLSAYSIRCFFLKQVIVRV